MYEVFERKNLPWEGTLHGSDISTIRGFSKEYWLRKMPRYPWYPININPVNWFDIKTIRFDTWICFDERAAIDHLYHEDLNQKFIGSIELPMYIKTGNKDSELTAKGLHVKRPMQAFVSIQVLEEMLPSGRWFSIGDQVDFEGEQYEFLNINTIDYQVDGFPLHYEITMEKAKHKK